MPPAPETPKWTAGPWCYQQNFLWRDTGKVLPEELLKLPDISGWIEGALNEDEEALANARLIAAAPTLYEQLAALVKRFETACRHAGSDDEFIQLATADVHAVLRKARGEP